MPCTITRPKVRPHIAHQMTPTPMAHRSKCLCEKRFAVILCRLGKSGVLFKASVRPSGKVI